jgi:ribosomal-protein-alanine N-acetyltransferase
MRWWDVPAVLALEQQCFAAFGQQAWTREQFWQELAHATRVYVVAVDDQSLIGYAGAFVLAPESDIQTVAVDPRHRGQGVGDLLMERLIGEARQAGATSMMLEVRADNPSALALYERHGFTPLSRRSGYYPDGGDALIWRRRPLERR